MFFRCFLLLNAVTVGTRLDRLASPLSLDHACMKELMCGLFPLFVSFARPLHCHVKLSLLFFFCQFWAFICPVTFAAAMVAMALSRVVYLHTSTP